MGLKRLISRSLVYYRWQHLGVVLGVAVATAVVTGALLVGDSVRFSLKEAALARLGGTHTVMATGDRFFRAELAEDAGDGVVAAVMQLYGVAVTPDLSARANAVQVLGIDQRYSELMGSPPTPAAGEVVLNTALSDRLGVQPGEVLILRFVSPTALSHDLPVGFDEDGHTVSLRVTVAGVVDDRFSLRGDQAETLNAYVSRDWLGERLALSGRSNLLLSDAGIEGVEEAWGLDDAQLVWREMEGGGSELSSQRVFMDTPVVDSLAGLPGERVLTYFVNAIEHGTERVPYSMVAAMGEGLGEDEVAINTWLAEDLGAGVGDRVTLRYYVADSGRGLEEAEVSLTVARVVPIEGRYGDRTLVPDFPGLKEVDQISDWDGGPMIDRSLIRQRDEDYWDAYGATPKAFISIERGQALWSNRFGSLTSIRFDPGVTREAVRGELAGSMVGLVPRDVRTPALAASRATVDFGALFLSLSFFIIAAAVLLTGLLFVLGVEQRSKELGVLTAVGWPSRRVRARLLTEGAVVALMGTAIGLFGGVGYTVGVLNILSGGWRGAVGGTVIAFHADGLSLLIGSVAGLVVSMAAMWVSLGSLLKRPARVLLSGGLYESLIKPGRARISWGVAVACLTGAVTLLGVTDFDDAGSASAGFFGVGAMLLCGALFGVYAVMGLLSGRVSGRMRLWRLALLNSTRRRGRSLAVVALIACGVFLVIAVSGFHQSTPSDPTRRDSGTGGFTLIAESTVPVLYDLNSEVGRDQYGLEADELPTGSVVAMRVSGGDDASCLNLNQVPTPRLLGVDAGRLAELGAFVVNDPAGWSLLDETLTDGAVPAIADANTAQWALKLKVGDTVTMTDDRGEAYKVRLVATINNSILQGSLIVSESAFIQKHPGVEGYRLLLVSVPAAQLEETSSLLTQSMADLGVAVTPAAERLATFNAVQNTYLLIFQALGGLGLMLGTAGIGVVVLRNVLERRRELAMMRAVGFAAGRQRGLIVMEHVVLLLIGLVTGTASAVITVAPAWRAGQPLGPLVWLVVLMGALGVFWVSLATRQALRGGLIDALRGE